MNKKSIKKLDNIFIVKEIINDLLAIQDYCYHHYIYSRKSFMHNCINSKRNCIKYGTWDSNLKGENSKYIYKDVFLNIQLGIPELDTKEDKKKYYMTVDINKKNIEEFKKQYLTFIKKEEKGETTPFFFPITHEVKDKMLEALG